MKMSTVSLEVRLWNDMTVDSAAVNTDVIFTSVTAVVRLLLTKDEPAISLLVVVDELIPELLTAAVAVVGWSSIVEGVLVVISNVDDSIRSINDVAILLLVKAELSVCLLVTPVVTNPGILVVVAVVAVPVVLSAVDVVTAVVEVVSVRRLSEYCDALHINRLRGMFGVYFKT